MQRAEQDRKYVALTEALSWIAFRTLLDAAGMKERLQIDPASWATLEDAMRQFSVAGGEGRLRARGMFVTDANDSDQARAGYVGDISENQFNDFQQFDIDRERLQYRPENAHRVLGTWGVETKARSPDGEYRTAMDWHGRAEEYSARAFQSYAGVKEDNEPSRAAGYEKVEVTRADLLQQFPAIPEASKPRRGRPPELDHDAVRARARELRKIQPALSVAAAAASLAVEFGPNLKTGQPWNARGIEKLIGPMWSSGEDK